MTSSPTIMASTAPASGDAQAAVSVRGLRHEYPARRPRRHARHKAPAVEQTPEATRPLALDAVSFDIAAGEIFGILGPNGSGKTTLFRILATLLRPSDGRVTLFGGDVRTHPREARARMGVLFQSPSLDGKLTARENLMHQGHLYGMRGPELRRRGDELLAEFNLADRADEAAERFSGGMRRKVELAKALLHRPRLLILDEPATGLDPGARRDLWAVLQRMRGEQGVTIALTTHLMDEADRCDRLAVMSQGKLAALDSPARLKAAIGGDVVTIEANDPTDAAALRDTVAASFGPWGAGEPVLLDGRIRFERRDAGQLVSALSQQLGPRARSITIGKPTLEDVFLHLTGHTFWRT